MHEDLCFSSEQVACDCQYFDVLFFLDFHGKQSVKESQKPKKAAGLALKLNMKFQSSKTNN